MSTQAQANMVFCDAEDADLEAAVDRVCGVWGILAGVAGLLYSVTFVVIAPRMTDAGNGSLGTGLYSLFLMAGGLLTTAALVALYTRLRETNASYAMWGLLLSTVAAMGAAIHGAYDL